MANRDDQPVRGLEPDHYRRSGLKDAVSHYLSPPNPLTSTAPQPFPNNLTMPEATKTALVEGWLATGDIGTVDEHGHLFIVDEKT